MMKKLVLVLAVVLVLSGIFAVAALTQVEIDREITATVASDTHDDVAVRFDVNDAPDYSHIAEVEDGEIVFNLSGALRDGDAEHYNAKAEFTIGSQEDQVVTITNNTASTIRFEIDCEDEGYEDILDILDGNENSIDGLTLNSGDDVDIHFVLDTTTMTDVADGAGPINVGAILQIRLAP